MDLPEENPSARGRDAWVTLTQHTSARIALGRSGGSLRTSSLLEFRLAHARARDAVHRPFDAAMLVGALRTRGLDAVQLQTNASDRAAYLARPDRGRELSDESRATLAKQQSEWGQRDLALIVSDGLSALAAERHAVGLVAALAPLLRAQGWTVFPVFVVPFARVKLQDVIGERLRARHALMLLGERPGLGAPDSLGAYFTHQPRAACTDADRNCVSNIRHEGLPPEAAARRLARLLAESARRGVSGVALKDAESLVLDDPRGAARA